MVTRKFADLEIFKIFKNVEIHEKSQYFYNV